MEGSAGSLLTTLEGWRRNAARPEVWKRSLVIGVAAGTLQAAMHQGDAWLRMAVTGPVLFKTLLSPVVAFGIALAAASCTSPAEAPRKPDACDI